MPIRNDALPVPSFWAWIAAGGLGCHGGLGVGDNEPPEASTISSLFGLDHESVEQWSNAFSGWHPRVFHESDGYLEDPSGIFAPLCNGIELRVEFHPGDWYWAVATDCEQKSVILGNVGGHWSQPGLRWQEAVAMSEVGNATTPLLLPLLLPLVWLTRGDDIATARSTVEDAWSASGLVNSATAKTLAELWSETAAAGRKYQWRHDVLLGWVTDAEWSVRHFKRPPDDVKRLNRLITLGISTA
jgi:hypothetical protein